MLMEGRRLLLPAKSHDLTWKQLLRKEEVAIFIDPLSSRPLALPLFTPYHIEEKDKMET